MRLQERRPEKAMEKKVKKSKESKDSGSLQNEKKSRESENLQNSRNSRKSGKSKKIQEPKKSKDYLMWLIPLIMLIFLVLEAAGLYYMTKYYGKVTQTASDAETTVAGSAADAEGTAQADGSEDESAATVQGDEDVMEAADGLKRDWDGEFGGIDLGNNTFTITWTSDFATSFEVQRYDTASLSWETVNILYRNAEEEDGASGQTAVGAGYIAEDGTCTYITPQLEPFQEYRYRVLASDADTWAISATLICETKECAISSIVWPVKDLTAYTTSSGYIIAGTVDTLKAYLVVDEADGRFGVEVGDETWYIDSDYCMINLPDYIGDLCEYDITNSYSSIYTVNNYSIPGVTGTVITGYENVSLEGNEYLVPLLYPAATKLVTAATSAKEQGYHLKIYDSYRPNDATNYLYSTVSDILYDTVPETDNKKTYREVMIGNSSYSLSNFLAKGRSNHNLGIALDLTLVDESTGRELAMQTLMHDLSHYAAVSENTENADLLRDIMVDAGFGTLTSEWWHFQDNDARDSLNLPTLSGGVSGLED